MLVALVVLHAISLICSLLFNAELLNMAGADIALKKLEVLKTYSQILASTSMCLLVWRLCYRRPDFPSKDCKDKGEGKAFIANLGVLISAQGSYVERIDKNFQYFAAAVFRGYTARNGDALYERVQENVAPNIIALQPDNTSAEGRVNRHERESHRA